MSREIINDGESGLLVRTKLNANYAELYSFYDEVLQDEAQTVGGVTVTALTIPVPLGESIAITFEVYGISINDNDECFARYMTGFRNVAGVVTRIDNSVDEIGRISDDPGVGGDADVAGTDGVLQVIGRAGETYDWKVTAGILRFVP